MSPVEVGSALRAAAGPGVCGNGNKILVSARITVTKTLADSVNAIMAKGRRERVISFAAQQSRAGIQTNARVLIEKANPGKFFSVVVQGRFGGGETYKSIEAGQDSWDLDTVATVRNTWLGSAPVSFGAERA